MAVPQAGFQVHVVVGRERHAFFFQHGALLVGPAEREPLAQPTVFEDDAVAGRAAGFGAGIGVGAQGIAHGARAERGETDHARSACPYVATLPHGTSRTTANTLSANAPITAAFSPVRPSSSARCSTKALPPEPRWGSGRAEQSFTPEGVYAKSPPHASPKG